MVALNVTLPAGDRHVLPKPSHVYQWAKLNWKFSGNPRLRKDAHIKFQSRDIAGMLHWRLWPLKGFHLIE